MEDADLREHCEKRLASMAAARQPFEQDWSEISRYCRSRTLKLHNADGRQATGGKRNTKLVDTHAVWAHGVLANGMATGLTSPATPWFGLTSDDPDLMEFQEVKEWVEDVKLKLLAFFQRIYNFYPASKALYGEMGLYGVGGQVLTEHWRHGGVIHNLTAGEYWIDQDDAGMVDTLYRRVDFSVDQMIQKFGERCSKRVKDLYDKSRRADLIACVHAIEPNQHRDWSKRDRRNMRWRDVYWELGTSGGSKDEKKGILSVGGFQEQPFWAPRWDVEGSDIYGHSPGMLSFPIARSLQLNQVRKQQYIDYIGKPALGGPPSVDGTNLVPGGYTAFAPGDGAQVGPIWQIQAQALQVVREDIADTRREIDALTFADMFLAITNMQGVQPRNMEEIASRNEEKLTQLGPVVDRVQNEMLRPAVDRAFAMLYRAGQLPPIPEDLQGRELKIEFISTLAQLQRSIGISSIERTLSVFGNLIGAFPSVADKLDVEQAADEYAQRIGAPARMVRSDDQVAKLREARQQQEQMAAMAAAAQPAQQAAQAAKTLSEISVGGGQAVLNQASGMAA